MVTIWRSPDAQYLALSSQDAYCTLVQFENNELGSVLSLSGLHWFSFRIEITICLPKLFPLLLFLSF